eukprot:8696580-Heterocapsa_arctica.AAC.1
MAVLSTQSSGAWLSRDPPAPLRAHRSGLAWSCRGRAVQDVLHPQRASRTTTTGCSRCCSSIRRSASSSHPAELSLP